MQLDFDCPDCNQKHKGTYSIVGKTIRCRRCGAPITVPGEDWWPTQPLPVQPAKDPAPEPKPKRRATKRRSERPPALPEEAEPLRTDIFREADMAYGKGAAGADIYGLNEPQVLPPRQRLAELPEAIEDPEFKAPPRAGMSQPARRQDDNYASFWSRLSAWGIDCFIMAGTVWLAYLWIAHKVKLSYATADKSQTSSGLRADEVDTIWIIFVIATLVVFVIYDARSISSEKQATYGKHVAEIKVVDLRGRRISLGRALVRELCKMLSVVTLFAGHLLVLYTPRKQALHDLIAGTMVVRS